MFAKVAPPAIIGTCAIAGIAGLEKTLSTLAACGGERAGTAGRHVCGVFLEAHEDAATAWGNVATKSVTIRTAGPQDEHRLARRHRRSTSRWGARRSSSRRRCASRALGFSSRRRRAAADRRDGTPARRRELRRTPLETLQRLGTSRLNTATIRPEIASARGTNGADLLGTRLLRFSRRRSRWRCACLRMHSRPARPCRRRRPFCRWRALHRLRLGARRAACGPTAFASGRRSASGNGRDGAPARSREVR